MSKASTDLIAKLSTDPDFRARFRDNPDQVMDEAGLSEEDKAAMKSGDPDRIREHLGDDAPPGCFVMFI